MTQGFRQIFPSSSSGSGRIDGCLVLCFGDLWILLAALAPQNPKQLVAFRTVEHGFPNGKPLGDFGESFPLAGMVWVIDLAGWLFCFWLFLHLSQEKIPEGICSR